MALSAQSTVPAYPRLARHFVRLKLRMMVNGAAGAALAR